jgi:glutamate dehydrogenase (NADP+)
VRDIHTRRHEAAEEYGSPGDLVLGANVAGFLQVAEAVHALGLV